MQLREAADALGVHYQTAYGWVRQGTLPARKTGRGYEVLDSDVLALAERRASGAAPRPEIRVRDWPAQAAGCTTPSWPVTRRWRGTMSTGSRSACRCSTCASGSSRPRCAG